MNARIGDLAGRGFTSVYQSVILKRPAKASHLLRQPNPNGSDKDHVMANKPLPSPEVLRQLMSYDPETGKLFWRERSVDWFKDKGRLKAQHYCSRWNSTHAGKEAGANTGRGYLGFALGGSKYKAHRAAWAIYYGRWPEGHIDHINHDPSDNRIANLRDVSQAENNKNRPPQKNSKAFVGVYKHKDCHRWVAGIGHKGCFVYLGLHACLGKAIKARRKGERDLGFHSGHGGMA